MPRAFPALPGFYQALFLYIEPLAAIFPAFVVWFSPGPSWFHDQLIPGRTPSYTLDPRTTIVIWHLGNCYMLLGLMASLAFRAIRDTLPDNPEGQERILGAILTAICFGDIGHMATSWIGLPEELRYSFGSWNQMTQANVTFTAILFCMRIAWFAGIGRERYYYGKASLTEKRQKSS